MFSFSKPSKSNTYFNSCSLFSGRKSSNVSESLPCFLCLKAFKITINIRCSLSVSKTSKIWPPMACSFFSRAFKTTKRRYMLFLHQLLQNMMAMQYMFSVFLWSTVYILSKYCRKHSCFLFFSFSSKPSKCHLYLHMFFGRKSLKSM